MKKKTRALCLFLAGVMILSFTACGKAKDDAASPAVITCGNTVITLNDLNQELDYYIQYYGVDTSDETGLNNIKEQVLEDYINTAIQREKATELGLYDLSEQEQQQVQSYLEEVHTNWESSLTSEIRQAQPDASDEEVAVQVQQQIDQYIEQTGYTDEYILNAETEYLVFQKLFTQSTQDVTLTDEELQTAYEEKVANAKSISEEQYAQIENALLSGSAYYVPEGFRYAKHILVGFDEEKQNELLTLRANTDDNDAAANADDKRAQYLAEIQSEADEVLAQVQAGGDFAALMAQYSDDTQALSYPNGYAVSPGATMFDTAFQQGVFSLENPGDVSALIPSDYGYHIILYSADVPAGVTPYEQVAEILRNEVLSTKQSTAYQAILDQWQTELHLTVDRAAFGLSEDDGSAADKTSAGDTAAANGENSDTNGEG